MVAVLLMSVGAAVGAAALTVLAVLALSFAVRLGDFGIGLLMVGPIVSGIVAFIVALRKLS
jgi:hypothetical protein